jgi:hypothetical protein
MWHRRVAGIGVILLGLGLTTISRSDAADMTVGFSWKGIEGCRGGGISPGFTVANAPSGTHTLGFTLEMLDKRDRVERELGGSTVPYPANGIIVTGAVFAFAPCTPGQYRWIVVARDSQGRRLATTEIVSAFPYTGGPASASTSRNKTF